MSEQPRDDYLAVRPFHAGVAGLESLAELALDMRSSWNHATDQVWRRLEAPVAAWGFHPPPDP